MAQFASAAFTGTDGTLLETADSNWSRHSYSSGTGVDIIIASNRIRADDAGGVAYYHSGSPAGADYSVSADIYKHSTPPTGYGAGVVGRLSTSAYTYYMGRHIKSSTADGWQLYKFVGGSATQLGSTATESLASGATQIKLEMIGSAIKLYDSGSGTATLSQTDSSITAAGKAGVRLGYSGSDTPTDSTLYHLDNFGADDVGSGAAALDGAATAQSTATGTLTTAIPIAGAAAVVASATGALSTAIPLAGQSAAISLAEGILTTTISLSGASLAEALATANLTAGSGLTGESGAVASALASLTTLISLSGASLAEALATANLTAGSGLTGAASGQASASGALLTEIPLVGASQSYSTAAGGLTTIIPLTGASASVASATGNLTLEATWSGAALAEALAGGTLTTVIRLDGAALGVAAASGALGVGTDTLPIHARHTLKAARRVTRITASPRQYRIAA